MRNTRDVDILLNRSDLPSAITALEKYGFLYRQSSGLTMFLDGSEAKTRDVVHILFAGEKVREGYVASVPLVDDCVSLKGVRTINLEALVRMKLTSYHDKDRVHLRDMISVGLIDPSWPSRFSAPLNERLQTVLDDPDG